MADFSDMLSKAKVMQEKMQKAQEQIKKIEVEGVAGGNLVKVVLSINSSSESEIRVIFSLVAINDNIVNWVILMPVDFNFLS